jgi:hypothetical protein
MLCYRLLFRGAPISAQAHFKLVSHDRYPKNKEICPVVYTFEARKKEASYCQARKSPLMTWFFKRGMRAAQPKNPHKEWAPIFKCFLWLALLSLLAHGAVFFWSITHAL